MQPRQPAKGSLPGGGLHTPSAPPFSSNPPMEPRRGSPPPLQPVGAAVPMQMSNQYVRTPVVRYSSKMRVGRIHPMKVSLTSNGVPSLGFQASPGTFDPPVVIQVTVPGAVVTPPHVIVPLAGGDANFYVQPLLAGRLVGGKVEFLSQGRKIGELALPMKANRGRLAKWLFFFALLVPFIINFCPEPTFTGPDRREPAASPQEKAEPKPFPALLDPDVFGGGEVVWVTTAQPPKKPTAGEQREPQKQSKDDKADANVQKKGETSRPPAKTEPGEAPKEDQAKPADPAAKRPAQDVIYLPKKGEEAITAWVRHRLHQLDYQTKRLSAGSGAQNPVADFFSITRRIEITSDSTREWDTGHVFTLGLYQAEPVLRFLYRVFVEFPRVWPFGDLIYCLAFLTLAVIVWLATNPNRKTLKGPVMNIHVGS